MSEIDRRTFLKGTAALGAAGASAVLLDACGGNGSTSPPPTLKKNVAEHVGVGVGKPKLGGSVTFGTEAEEAGIDPTYAHFDSTGVLYARAVYDPLAIVDFNGNVQPYLAESITPNSDYTKWVITLRPNIVFHDGTPLDQQALLFCMREFLISALTNFAFTNYMDVKNPNKAVTPGPGPLSVTLNMEQPWVPFEYWLAGYIGGQMAYVFSPTAYQSKGEAYFNTHPVGTGPFVFQQWVPGSHFSLTKNRHYWRKDRYGNRLPYVDSWTYKPIPDVDTRYSALESGEIQIMHTDYDPIIQQVIANSSLASLGDNSLSVGEPDIDFIMINVADKIMSDIDLRKALAYGTNQAAVCRDLGKNITTPTNGPFPAPSPFHSDTGYPQYDLAKAKSYFKAFLSRYGGKQPTITYTTTNTTQSQADASYMRAMWQAFGLNVQIAQVEQSSLIDDALQGGYQMFSWRQFANVNPDLNYIFWATTSGPINFARNYDPIIQKALDTARQSGDPSVRAAEYEKIAHRFAVDLPYIYTNRDVWYIAAQKSIQNWNNPTTPTGGRGLTMLSGIIWPTEIWVS
ncbi:MAG TPA: ABC transporter substrate-binding protein [Acidimicrobiales bacterium]|nr:ABC transporter substrate-binding protein [Acidimicrobiales bacterium]